MSPRAQVAAAILQIRAAVADYREQRREMKKVGWGATPALDASIDELEKQAQIMEDNLESLPND